MIFKLYKCPLFGAQVYLIASCSYEDYVKTVRKKLYHAFAPEDNGQTGQFTRFKAEDGHRFWSLWIDSSDSLHDINLIHETLHVAEDILECVRVEASGEILAYYQGFWLEKFKKALIDGDVTYPKKLEQAQAAAKKKVKRNA